MTAPVARRSVSRILPPSPVLAALVMLVFTALLYVIEAVDQVSPFFDDSSGIRPWSLDGLTGILWAPFLHAGWAT